MRQIDVHKIADEARFNGFHGLVLFWCALIIIFDGYDLAVAGIALPSIMKQMGVQATQAGFMVSSALFGMMFGAIFLGTIADRIGRRWAIVICIALFSVFTAAAGLTSDPVMFSITRFLAGLGIGGVMPNVVAQMTEYAPRKVRSTMVTLMFSGYAVGGMLAAVLGKGLIESHGWQSVFLAAALPVVLIPFILKSLPESMPFLLKQGRHDELKAIVARLDVPELPPECRGPLRAARRRQGCQCTGAPAVPGRPGLQHGDVLDCVLHVPVHGLRAQFLVDQADGQCRLQPGFGPDLRADAELRRHDGAVGGGWLADRFSIKWVLFSMYVLAAVSITLLGVPMPTEALFLVVGLAGASTIGTQIVTYAYAGQFYPMAIRSTGIGFASGVGRQRCHPGADRHRHAGGHGTSAAAELHCHRASRGDRCGGGGDDRPRPLRERRRGRTSPNVVGAGPPRCRRAAPSK